MSFIAALSACTALSSVAYAQMAEPTQPVTPAQPVPDSSTSVDDIVVTARKRDESVQDVPITISVTSGETLQRAGIADLDGLKAVTSGLTMRRSANQVTVPTLRGLGTGTSSETYEQSIAGFLDGTYIGRSPEMNAGIFDLQRVEIMKGTQAALLAKNTSLGAISMITRKPGADFAYNFSAGYEFELDSHNLEGGIDLPVSDTFAIRLAGLTHHQGGWVHNDISGSDDPRTGSWIGRAVAVWTPNDRLDATLVYQSFNTETLGNGVEFVADVLGNARARALAAGNTDFEARLDRHNSPTNASGERSETSGDRVIGTLNYQLGDFVLTSVSAYGGFDQHVNGDKDFNTGSYSDQTTDLSNRLYSQELRITSPGDRALSYILGVYAQHEVFDYYRISDNRVIVPNGIFSDGVEITTDTYSLFGSANYDFGNGLSANLGLRVTNESREGAYGARTYSVPGSISALYPAFAAETRDVEDTNVDGSIGLQYKTEGGALYYVSAARGTKGATFLSAPSTPATSLIPAEEATTYETGAKWTLDRGFFNVSLFNTEISNLQQATFNGSIFVTDPRDVRSYGLEVDAAYRLTDDLRLTGSATYARARQKADATHPGDNSRVVNAPLWTANIGLQYERDIGEEFRMSANVNAEYRSDVIFVPEASTASFGTDPNVAVVPIGEANTKLNARLGFGPQHERWEVALVGRNLSDELILAYAIPGTFQSGSAVGSSEPPRTVMLQLNLRY